MIRADQLLQRIDLSLLFLNLFLLLLDLRLLFVESIYENGAQAIVLDAFDLATFVIRNKQRINFGDILRAEADIMHPTLFPIERDRSQLADKTETGSEGRDPGIG